MPDVETADSGTEFDMDAAVERLGADLFPEPTTTPETTDDLPDEVPAAPEIVAKTPPPPSTAPQASSQAPEPPVVSPAPKSWPKEMHDHWGKTPPEVQKYWETREKQMLEGLDQYKGAAQFGKAIQDVVTPYQHILQSQGVDAPRAVGALLQAHQRLTMGTVESRRAAYEELGRNLGFGPAPTAHPEGTATPPPVMDPRVQSLEERFNQIQQTLTAQQQAALETARTKAAQDVEAFASDPAHNLFDECADDIVRFVQQGASLQEAYDKAVWANPVTREKQMQTRLQTEAEKARERARLDALPKKKAAGANVRGRETQRTPTEPLGSMEDTMRETLAKLKAR